MATSAARSSASPARRLRISRAMASASGNSDAFLVGLVSSLLLLAVACPRERRADNVGHQLYLAWLVGEEHQQVAWAPGAPCPLDLLLAIGGTRRQQHLVHAKRCAQYVTQAKSEAFARQKDGICGNIRPGRREHQLDVCPRLILVPAALHARNDLDVARSADQTGDLSTVELLHTWSGSNATDNLRPERLHVAQLEGCRTHETKSGQRPCAAEPQYDYEGGQRIADEPKESTARAE